MTNLHLRMGTRGSLLARMQSDWTAREIEGGNPGLTVETIIIKTTGDRIVDRPLYEEGGKGLFTKELEVALLEGGIDFAVHSYKDVPVTMPLVEQGNLRIVATPAREDPRDVLVSMEKLAIEELAVGAKVGTSSLRRRCQLLALRDDLSIHPIRGNIDTRLRKLREGEFDGVVLALAGVKRAGLFDEKIMHVIAAAEMLPAAGQGALAIQCRADDYRTIGMLKGMNDEVTAACVLAERELVRRLNGDCHSPIAALAEIVGDVMHFRGAVGGEDGGLPVKRGAAEGKVGEWERLVGRVVEGLRV